MAVYQRGRNWYIDFAMTPNVSWLYKYQGLTGSYVPYFLKIFRGVL